MESHSSPHLILNPACIPVPLCKDPPKVIRPIPQRPADKASSSERLSDAAAARRNPRTMEKKSLTDPRQARVTEPNLLIVPKANPIKLRSSVSPSRHISTPDYTKPERDKGSSYYVTSVTTSGSTLVNVGCEEDSGYQILSTKDEEAERDTGGGSNYHDHHVLQQQNKASKPRRNKGPRAKTHEHSLQQRFWNKGQQQPQLEDPKKAFESVSHLLDVKAAIERLKLHPSPMEEEDEFCQSSSESSSGSEILQTQLNTQQHQQQQRRRTTAAAMGKNLSQETLNASTVTSADEFVWIDSHNRLVELQQLPWTNSDMAQVVIRSMDESVAPEVLSRLSYYTQRVLVRVAREAQRLSKTVGKCGSREVSTALKTILSPGLALTALRACLRSVAMYAISGSSGGDATRQQSKSERAGLALKVGRMHQWMCLVKIGKFIQGSAAIYLTAGIESLVEEVVSKCLEAKGDSPLTASLLEQVVASNGDFWGLFQPYAHLSSSRVSTGTLVLAPCVEAVAGGGNDKSNGGSSSNHHSERNVRQILLTTCVGSTDELEEMVLIAISVFQRMWQSAGSSLGNSYRPLSSVGGVSTASASSLRHSTLQVCPDAIVSLYHFMRCSQLEYVGQDGRTPIQELVYERPYMVLPPIMEWVRVMSAFAEHRQSPLVDSDDVHQAARVLLPGMDCPPRPLESSHTSQYFKRQGLDELQLVAEMKQGMAFQMLMTGRKELVPHALQLLPSGGGGCQKLCNSEGLTPLQLAAVKGDLTVIRILLDTGADIDGEGEGYLDNKKWTPLTYACLAGHAKVAKFLLDRGAKVNGGAAGEDDEDMSETPLQLAAAAGNVRVAELLIAHGANPFRATMPEDHMGLLLPSASQSGCPAAVSVAAIHGHRRLLHVMVTQCLSVAQQHGGGIVGALAAADAGGAGDEEVLSLEEILAEGVAGGGGGNASATVIEDRRAKQAGTDATQHTRKLSKVQSKRLQEAMYHASECGNVELTLDLRNLGVAWTPFAWVQTLRAANDNQQLATVNELLQDFVADWLEKSSNNEDQSSSSRAAGGNAAFLAEVGLPLLFSIFRTCKNESTVLLLADIFSLCHGRGGSGGRQKAELRFASSPSDSLKDPPPRIDSRFVNNPELSDLQFRVEGRIFYAHKLALITASQRFQSMLNSRFCEGNPPVLQINDIRYDIFHLVMTYLYNGGLGKLKVDGGDVLELMAAANFFQLPGLLRHCEILCAQLIDLDNIVSYYIHAKVYSALDLLDYCEGFLLKNLVALLTYDDSVKRLIFGKKLQNHDVLRGLMTNLQRKIQVRVV